MNLPVIFVDITSKTIGVNTVAIQEGTEIGSKR
jgi:hypothetical protein